MHSCTSAHVPQCACGGHWANFRHWFSPSTLWVLRMTLDLINPDIKCLCLLTRFASPEACFLIYWNSSLSGLLWTSWMCLSHTLVLPKKRKGDPGKEVRQQQQFQQMGATSPGSAVPSHSIFLRSKAKDSTVSSMTTLCLNYQRDNSQCFKERIPSGQVLDRRGLRKNRWIGDRAKHQADHASLISWTQKLCVEKAERSLNFCIWKALLCGLHLLVSSSTVTWCSGEHLLTSAKQKGLIIFNQWGDTEKEKRSKIMTKE